MKRKVEEEAEEGDFQHNRIFSLPHPPMHQPPLPPHQPPLPPMPPHQPPPPMSHHPPLPMSHQLGQPHFVGRGRGPWMQRRQQELMRGGGFGAAGSPNGNMVNGNMMGARHFFRGARGMPNNIGPLSNRGFFPRARGPRFNNSFQREFYQENYWNQPPMPIPFQQQPMPHPPLSPSSHQMQPHQRPEGEGCNQGNALPKTLPQGSVSEFHPVPDHAGSPPFWEDWEYSEQNRREVSCGGKIISHFFL
ncbi:hypothetical protein PR048_029318 [Dryococelus australis]|uniref:Uncharacterized protein n=1 Tax=Dryococelus australis TaxID=614101 RepID=A0ABQ9GFP0_9NEOP|nr:hypothetical protein PR048_029318 [Dryococelus australis]